MQKRSRLGFLVAFTAAAMPCAARPALPAPHPLVATDPAAGGAARATSPARGPHSRTPRGCWPSRGC